MAGTYTIRYRGCFPPNADRDATNAHVFDVEGDGSAFAVAALMFDEREGMDVLLRAAALEIEQRLAIGVYPPEDTSRRVEIFYSSAESSRLRAVAESEKECLWQNRTPRGYLCEATVPGGDKRTTSPLCATCEIPDARLICVHLVHPMVDADVAMGVGLMRDAVGALCNAGHDAGTGENCRPGGLGCWERRLATGPTLPKPPPDVAKRVADEMDYIGLVFRDRYRGRLWSFSQARSIAELFGDCTSEQDFQRRIAVIADLLAQLDPSAGFDAPPEDSEGNPLRPLAALERLVDRDYPEGGGHVRTLRQIPRVRNAFPQHSRTEGVIAGWRALGVDYPATDWHLAWLQVLTAFWASLEGIRAAIQAGPPAGEVDDSG